jgi:hypothetical protein
MRTHGGDWGRHIDAALLHFRIRPHTSTGFPPYELHHNRKIRFNSGVPTKEEDDHVYFLESELTDEKLAEREELLRAQCKEVCANFKEAQELIYSEAASNIEKAQRRQKKAHTKRNNQGKVDVSVGEPSYVLNSQTFDTQNLPAVYSE